MVIGWVIAWTSDMVPPVSASRRIPAAMTASWAGDPSMQHAICVNPGPISDPFNVGRIEYRLAGAALHVIGERPPTALRGLPDAWVGDVVAASQYTDAHHDGRAVRAAEFCELSQRPRVGAL